MNWPVNCSSCLFYKIILSNKLCGLNLYINMQWWHFVSLGIWHCSHARLPALAVTLQFGQSWCSTVSVLPMRMRDVPGVRSLPCWAALCSTSNGWVPWLAARSDPKKKKKEVKSMCMPAALIPSSVCLCVTLNCVFWIKRNLVCVLMTFFEPDGCGPDDAPRFWSGCFTIYR